MKRISGEAAKKLASRKAASAILTAKNSFKQGIVSTPALNTAFGREMMKSKNVSCTDRLQFVLLSLASLLIIDLALETLIDFAFGMQASGYPRKEQLTHVTIALAYAATQRCLLARYLRLELRHWLY